MTLLEFWNNAFLAALSRLPAVEAKEEADKAVEIAIKYWQGQPMARQQGAWLNDCRIDQITEKNSPRR